MESADHSSDRRASGRSGYSLAQQPAHVERAAAIARALRLELGTDAMVEISTFGRPATRVSVPHVGPAHATPRCRERLVRRVREKAVTVVDGGTRDFADVAIGAAVLHESEPVAAVCAWLTGAVSADDAVSLVELAAVGFGGWWTQQTQRRQLATARALDSDRAMAQERKRLGYDLHGSVAQELAAARINAETAEILARDQGGKHQAALRAAVSHIERAQRHTRQLINSLSGEPTENRTLAEIIERIGREYQQKLSLRRPATLALSVSELPTTASTELSGVVAFVLREALQNVYEHADAENVSVTASFETDELLLVVADDGVGPPANVAQDGAVHLGVQGIIERVGLIGGSVTFDGCPEAGTRLSVGLPIEPDTRG